MDITTIVVPDAAATPVNHTFNKQRVNGDAVYMVEQSSSAAIGYWPLKLSLRSPVPGQPEPTYRAQIALAIPVVVSETINGISRPSLEYTLRATVDFVMPAASTLQNRKDLRKILSGILNDSNVAGMIENQLNLS